MLLAILFLRLSPAAEVQPGDKQSLPGEGTRSRLGLHRSRHVVFRLAVLFALDAFGGGFVIQSIVAVPFLLAGGIKIV